MLVAPGLILAATGVGAGDLLTASLAGSTVGLSLLWCTWFGALLKWSLNEGLSRWQMATGSTLIEGWSRHLGWAVIAPFTLYFLLWTFFTGGALVNACGVAATALFPLSDDLRFSKILWGIVHALVGFALVRAGGFRAFEKLMGGMICVMFVTVVTAAALSRPDLASVARGLVVPQIEQVPWALALLGGVGGTVTLLSYGYWIREQGREGSAGLRACRIDLAVCYSLTALFGASMVIVGSKATLERGPTVALDLASQLEVALGGGAKWVFLVGFWSAVFSSLLGVWQSAPYLFADLYRLTFPGSTGRLAESRPYRGYLLAVALGSLPLLWFSVKGVQLAYAMLGALFMPLLAITLLALNNRQRWIGREFANGWAANAMLILTLLVFALLGARKLAGY